MNDLQRFEYEGTPLRTIEVDGEPWFVAKDVALILGYRDAANLTRRLDEEDRGTRSVSTPSGEQTMSVVTEAGLYVAVLGSQIAGARDFKRWITHEVLPSIRRTGSYTAAPELTEDQIVAQALQITTAKISELESKVREDAPKVEYIDTFVAEGDLLQFRHVAATLGVKESELRGMLLKRKWIYAETTTRWSDASQAKKTITRYSAYAAKKPYFQPVMVHDAPRFRGEVMHTLKITPAGAAAVARLYRTNAGQLAVVV